MRALRSIASIIDRLGGVGIWIAVSALFVMVMLTVFETLARYLFNAPVIWAIEIPEYTLTFATAGALAYTQKVRGHIAVGLVEARLRPSRRGKLSAVLYPVYLAVVLFITWAAFRLMWKSLIEWRLSDTMEVPLFIPYLMIFIGFAVLSLAVMVDLARAISAARKGAEYRMTKGEG